MSWKDLLALVAFVLGIILFLYGSNLYNVSMGWVGVFVMIASTAAEIALESYRYIRKMGT